MNGRNGGVAYAVQTAVNGGSELLIFVPRAAHRHDLWAPRTALTGAKLHSCVCYPEVLRTGNVIVDYARSQGSCIPPPSRPEVAWLKGRRWETSIGAGAWPVRWRAVIPTAITHCGRPQI